MGRKARTWGLSYRCQTGRRDGGVAAGAVAPLPPKSRHLPGGTSRGPLHSQKIGSNRASWVCWQETAKGANVPSDASWNPHTALC